MKEVAVWCRKRKFGKNPVKKAEFRKYH